MGTEPEERLAKGVPWELPVYLPFAIFAFIFSLPRAEAKATNLYSILPVYQIRKALLHQELQIQENIKMLTKFTSNDYNFIICFFFMKCRRIIYFSFTINVALLKNTLSFQCFLQIMKLRVQTSKPFNYICFIVMPTNTPFFSQVIPACKTDSSNRSILY